MTSTVHAKRIPSDKSKKEWVAFVNNSALRTQARGIRRFSTEEKALIAARAIAYYIDLKR